MDRRPGHHFLVVSAVVLVLMTVITPAAYLLLSVLLRGAALPDGWFFLLTRYAPYALTLAALLAYTRYAEPEILRGFGCAVRGGLAGNTARMLLAGLLAGLLMNLFCVGAAVLHGELLIVYSGFDAPYLLAALALTGVQAGAEELVFRGFAFAALRERYGTRRAAAFSAVLFAALHALNPGVTVAGVLLLLLWGLAMCAASCEYRSLWLVCGMHTAWNYTQSFLFGLPNSGVAAPSSLFRMTAAADGPFYSTGFGLEGGAAAIAVFAALLGFCLLRGAGRRQSGDN